MAESSSHWPSFFGYTNTTSGSSSSGGRSRRAGGSQRGDHHLHRKQLDEFDKGDIVEGVVRAVNPAGVWVDVGAVKDALLPLILSGRAPPLPGDRLEDLRVTDVDPQRMRLVVSLFGSKHSGGIYFHIAGSGHANLSEGPGVRGGKPLGEFELGQTVAGVVRTVIKDIGAFIDVGAITDGLLHWDNVPKSLVVEKGSVIESLYIHKLDLERNRLWLGVLQDVDGVLTPFRKGKGRGKGKISIQPRSGRPLEEFRVGQEVHGIVTRNVIDQGVFIDIGAAVDARLDHSLVPQGVAFKKGSPVRGLHVLEVMPERKRLSVGLLSQDPPSKLGEAWQQNSEAYGGSAASARARSSEPGRPSGSAHAPRSDRGLRASSSDRGSYARAVSTDPAYDGADAFGPADGDLYGGGYEQEGYEAEGHYIGGTFSGKGGSTAYPSSVSSYGHLSGTDAEDEDHNFLDDDDPEPHQAAYERKRKRSLMPKPLPGKSGLGVQRSRSEPEDDGLFVSITPGIRDWLSRIQEPELQGAQGPAGDGYSLGAEDARTDAGDDGEGSVDDEDVAEELSRLTLGAVVDGTVTRVTEQGARVDFGCIVEGILPQRLIDWPVRVGDEVVDLVISRVDLERRRVTLAVEHSEVDDEKVGAFTPSSRSAVAKGSGRGTGGGGRGRGGRGQGRGAGRDLEQDGGGDRHSDDDGAPGSSYGAEGDLREVEEEVAPLLVKIFSGQRSAARELAKAVAASRRPVQACFNASGALKVLMKFNNCAAAALLGIQELNEKLGRESEPLLARIIPAVLEKYGDRQRSVQVAAEDAAETIIARLNPYGVDAVLPAVLKVLQRREKTDVKVGALRLLALMRDEDTIRPLARKLDEIVPCVVDMLGDVKKDVRTAARETAKAVFECARNRDLEPYLGDIIDALTSQEKIPGCVSQLSEIVFVQPVETQALAVLMPLVQRGLKDRDERTKRKALVIADNMCKLVPDVSEIHPFLGTLIPLVKKAKEHISDREVLSVADGCLQTLDAANKAGRKKVIDKSEVHKILYSKIPEEKQEVVTEIMADYVADLCRTMSACRTFDHAEWWQCIAPYLTPHLLSKAECSELVLDLLENCYDAAEGDDVEDNDEEGEDLCNCVFSLGYGALTLLNSTRLHLKRGKCYGLCGPNDCGKSTLLRAINNEQVDGFPPKTELVTAFVEHGIGEKEPECDWTPLEYMFADETIQAMQISKKKVVAALRSLGFDNHKLRSEIGHLSGGWKMKLGLVRAMLMCADILLLDEPTGHLDADNSAWLGDYILGVKNDSSRPVTTIVVSHDTAFLDKVCTHIISIKQRKLKTYKGSITEFVKRQPDAQAYLTLASEKSKFALPEPGMLEGVRSRGKKLLRMHNVTYTYPNSEAPTLVNVSIEVSMLSRVAVIGPNGSGKSTLVRALVGELPLNHSLGDSSLWKHPNARISYVAQHAFHHIEQHLDKTALQYMLWRFAGGEDREAVGYKAEEVGRQRRLYFFKDGLLTRVTDSKDKAMAVEPEQILGRRRAKRLAGSEDQYEYETKWRSMPVDSSTWVSREKLVDMGAVAMVQREDEKQAVVQGILARPLTQPQIEEHLSGFGLESSFASHTRLGVLSGGQKVKVVLGAATWQSPHILILDEPTNYLDRESLGALASALKEFGGGVIVVSHNREFCHTVCDERWVMDNGHLAREGALEKQDVLIEHGEGADQFIDESGNLHERQRSMKTERDIKRQRRQREMRRKRGEEVSSGEDDFGGGGHA